MPSSQEIHFPPFHLDIVDECLWRGKEKLTIRPKTFAVLRYLVEHAGRLVTHKELREAVWPGIRVSEVVPKVCVGELRAVLGDSPKVPRFIETAHGRGYRFVGTVVSNQLSVINGQPAVSTEQKLRTDYWQLTTPLVGRETELAQLHRWLDTALHGERQIVFVTGEAGIGKTTLVDAFVKSVLTEKDLWIGRGQCVEHYGAGEAYQPVLEALGQVCRGPEGNRQVEVLRRYAPTWLINLPWLLSEAEQEALRRKTLGTTREGILREIAEAVEALTAEKPLVLVLEDLHWSDYSTLDLISFLAQRREPARLLLIGTYRPVDAAMQEHPLRAVQQELQTHKQCEELRLGFLTEAAVAEYLVARFAVAVHDRQSVHALARVIYEQTNGNPLFMLSVIDDLVAQGVIERVNGGWTVKAEGEDICVRVPENLRQMIEKQIERLDKQEQRMLEVASVAGMEFSAAVLDEEGKGNNEERCAALARKGQLLQPKEVEEWPDGTVAARYGFIHSLYQNVLYERVPVGRRTQLHRQIGERKERGYRAEAGTIAAELAVHFEQGRDYPRAVQYLQQAGNRAVERSAYREAFDYLTKGLGLLATLPDTPERSQQELTLQVCSVGPLIATKGYATPEVEQACDRALVLCRRLGETAEVSPVIVGPVLGGLWTFFLARAQMQTARELAEQRFHLAQRLQAPALLLLAHLGLGITLFYLGELALARMHLEEGLTLYLPRKDRSYSYLYEFDPGVVSLSYVAWTLWLLGYPDQARKRCVEALSLAQDLAHPHTLAATLNYASWLHQLCREETVAKEEAEAAIILARKQGFVLWQALGTLIQGWTLNMQGQKEKGLEQMRKGLMWYQATGAEVSQPYMLALLADASGQAGHIEDGLALLDAALMKADGNGERYYEAELYRLKGTLTLQSKVQSPKSKQKWKSVFSRLSRLHGSSRQSLWSCGQR